jgi:hypothetical protein
VCVTSSAEDAGKLLRVPVPVLRAATDQK